MKKNLVILILVVAVVIGYCYGRDNGFEKGYDSAPGYDELIAWKGTPTPLPTPTVEPTPIQICMYPYTWVNVGNIVYPEIEYYAEVDGEIIRHVVSGLIEVDGSKKMAKIIFPGNEVKYLYEGPTQRIELGQFEIEMFLCNGNIYVPNELTPPDISNPTG